MLKKIPVNRYRGRYYTPNFDHIEIFIPDYKHKFISRKSADYIDYGIYLYIKQKNIDGS